MNMQTGSRETLSLARQGLQRIHEEIGRLLEIFLDRKSMTKGTVYELKRKCGKPSCRCAQGELHGSMALSWSEQGKTRLHSVPKGKLAEFKIMTRRYQKFRQARARLVKLQQDMIVLIDKLEAARTGKV